MVNINIYRVLVTIQTVKSRKQAAIDDPENPNSKEWTMEQREAELQFDLATKDF